MDGRERRSTSENGGLGLIAGADGCVPTLHDAILGEMRAGRLLEAQLACQRSLETKPDDTELLHLMASICLKANEFDHAVEWASRAIRGEAKPSYLTTLGSALMRLGRQQEALQVFDKAVQLKPDEADLWRHLGNALLEAARTSEALLCFQRTVELNPGDGAAAYAAGVLLKEEGRFDEALVCLERS